MSKLVSDIGMMIHSAIAPVFLLLGVGTMLGVLTRRLGRIVDRARMVEQMRLKDSGAAWAAELRLLYRRCRLIGQGVALATACGLLVCVVITMLFIGQGCRFALDRIIAGSFIAAMLCLSGAFVCFFLEVRSAARFMRVRQVRFPD